ncbi:hypothetical protein SUNI508_10434 [Seiridium unicorne]|uniref:Uncharacterized protein n=1 Tax=Seiridium unicorne TaxID=138068 RepID=A0ABR2ULW3_9PEZI
MQAHESVPLSDPLFPPSRAMSGDGPIPSLIGWGRLRSPGILLDRNCLPTNWRTGARRLIACEIPGQLSKKLQRTDDGLGGLDLARPPDARLDEDHGELERYRRRHRHQRRRGWPQQCPAGHLPSRLDRTANSGRAKAPMFSRFFNIRNGRARLYRAQPTVLPTGRTTPD